MSTRYFLKFRHSDTGLTPTFTTFKKVADLSVVTPPTPVVEIGFGEYYFDYTPTFDITFEVDGGASIPTEEVRYIADTLSPRDTYLDEPISQVKTDVWNEPISGHATDGTFGQTLQLIASGQATAGGASSITLAVGSSSINNFYNEALIVITAGTGIGQSRVISSYVGGTRVATVAAWATAPDATSHYMIQPAAVATAAAITTAVWNELTTAHNVDGSFGQALQLLAFGQATAGGPTSLTLAVGSSAINDFYKDALLIITAGTGVGQARNITSYVGGTRVANVASWVTAPDATSHYMLLPAVPQSASAPTVGAIASAVWDELTAGHMGFGSFGQTLQLEDSGICKGGAASTITLQLGVSAVDDFYKNGLVVLTGGTGVRQARSITGYVGATRIATVDRPWATGGIPVTDDTEYMIIPAAPAGSSAPTAAAVAAAVWDETAALHVAGGTFGKLEADTKTVVDTVNTNTAPAAIATSVWDAVMSAHVIALSTGSKLNSSGGLTGAQTAAAVWDALTASYTALNSFGARAATDSGNIKRSLGMLHENSVLDNTTFTVDNNLLTGRMRIYDSKTNADAAQAASPGIYNTGKIAEYSIVATYTGVNLKTYKVSLEP